MVGEGSSVEDGGGYMLDTTEFNAVAKAELPLSSLAGRRLFATHVQLDELENTPGEELRARLRAAFEEIAAENLTRQVLFGMSVSDQACYAAEDGIFQKMLARLEKLDGKKLHQLRDILIAETAIKNRLVLVSGDRNLRSVTTEYGGRAIEITKPPR
jgi:hypothetical protein